METAKEEIFGSISSMDTMPVHPHIVRILNSFEAAGKHSSILDLVFEAKVQYQSLDQCSGEIDPSDPHWPRCDYQISNRQW